MEKEYEKLMEQPYIEEERKCFGLLKYTVYAPTNSRLREYKRYYDFYLREELKDLFARDEIQFVHRLAKLGTYKEVYNGNVMIAGMVSEDKQFVSIRLFLFEQIGYEPASISFLLQGEDARQAAGVFSL